MSTNSAADTSSPVTIQSAIAAGRLSPTAAENLNCWLTQSQYAQYVPRIQQLVDEEQFEQLDTMFWEVIAFGTGGRRGLMGELGCATINERTIAESAHGLAAYLRNTKGEPGGRAVVACDSRIRSDEFARLTASIFAAHGLHVFFFESNRSTPELSFAVRHLGCDIGAMISASHNPPSDNGFKAYWSTGGQVLAPHDKGIIECVYEAGEIPTVDFDDAVADETIEIIGEALDRAYLDAVQSLSLSSAREIPVLYSPLHGVGETSVYRLLQEAGFDGVEIYEPQRAPDGRFPNVPDQLPNPERTEVFTPLIAHAKESGAALVIASDPDADRLGVAGRDQNGEFVHLSGNRVGGLMTDYVLRKRAEQGTLTPEHYIVETLVTTPLMAVIARAHQVRVINNLLVGFKFIGQAMDQEGPDKFIFGAEESLGYLAGEYCRDKDAAIGALYLLELAAELRSEGKTLLDRLDELYLEHGYFAESQQSFVCKGSRGKEQIDGLMRTFREQPPQELAEIQLVSVRDYKRHEIRSIPANEKMNDVPAPDGDLLIFDSAAGDINMSLGARPSGTEPKIKFYFFAHSKCEQAGKLAEVRKHTDSMMSDFQQALSNWVDETLTSL